MQTEKVGKLIVYILSIIMLGYILYVSVYNQIISQSDGFFNMIIFAGILLLLFILISLIVKLMAYTPTNDISPALKYAMLFGAACLIILSIFLRLNYTSSVPADESVIFKTCEYINDGTLAEASELTDELLYIPGNFAYSFLVSILFRIGTLNSNYIIYMNIMYLCVMAVFTYLLVSLITDKICGMLAFLITLFIPGNTFAVYSFGFELYYAANFVVTAYLFALLIYKSYDQLYKPIIISVLAGIFSGILVFCEPLSILLVIAFTVWVILNKNQNIIPVIIPPVLMIIVFISLVAIKSSMLDGDFISVLGSMFKALNPLYDDINGDEYAFGEIFRHLSTYVDDLNLHIVNNYYFLTSKSGNTYSSLQAIWLQLGNQLIFMFMIIMAVANVLYLLKSTIDRILPFFTIFIATFFIQLFGAKYARNGLYFGVLLVVLGVTTIQNMFINHHPDITDVLYKETAKDTTKEEDITNDVSFEEMEARRTRSRIIAFYGENDLVFEQIKREEKENKMNADIAATKISTGFDEEGQYVSQVEAVEYFDDVDEPVEVKHVSDIKAIPGTRPVEVVKPISADEPMYFDSDDSEPVKKIPAFRVEKPEFKKPEVISPITEITEDNISPLDDGNNNDSISNSIEKVESSNNTPADEVPTPDGFVFRKRDRRENDIPLDNNTVKKNSRIQLEKIEKKQDKKESKKEDKKAKKSKLFEKNSDAVVEKEEKAKRGEPLHNPLPLPKPHVTKDFDFDIDISDSDDFDY